MAAALRSSHIPRSWLTAQRRSQQFGHWQRLADHLCIVDYSRIFSDSSMASIKSKRNFSQLQGFNLQNRALHDRRNRALSPLTLETNGRSSNDQIWAIRGDGSCADACTRGPCMCFKGAAC